MKNLNIKDLLSDYQGLPEYVGTHLIDVNQLSLFGDRPIHVAATRNAIEEMEMLLAHGAEMDATGEHGYTALHNAVEQGHLEAVAWLIERGANRNLRNDDGLTPSTLAFVLGHDAIRALFGALSEP